MRAKGLKSEPLYTQIVDEILSRIREGELQPGQRVPSESEIARTFGVGRNSVREAIKALTIGGIVYSRAGRGTFISQNALELLGSQGLVGLFKEKVSLVEMMEVRLILEVAAAGLAAERRRADELADLERQLEHLRVNVSQNKSWSEEGLAFHMMIAKMGKNKLLVHLLEYIIDVLDNSRELLAASDCDILAMLDDHAMVCEAIRKRDTVAAQDAMRTHIRRVIDVLAKSGSTAMMVSV